VLYNRCSAGLLRPLTRSEGTSGVRLLRRRIGGGRTLLERLDGVFSTSTLLLRLLKPGVEWPFARRLSVF